MLRVEELTIAHGATEIVHSLSFTIETGKATALVGRSGSGKSSVIAAIANLLPQGSSKRGRIEWTGKLGVIFQEPALALDPLMRIGKQIAEVSSADKVPSALAEMGLAAELAKAYPHQLSGGMRQRALIALALSRDPEVLLLDEPTAQLDAITRKDVLEKLDARRKRSNATMLFATHDLELAKNLCESIVVLPG